MSMRSMLAVVLLLIGVSTTSAEDRAAAEARRVVPAPLRGWSGGGVAIERQAVLDGMQSVIVRRTYTAVGTREQVTITVETFNPIMSAFIDGAYAHKGADDPVTRAGMRQFEFGSYRGIASGPDESLDKVMLVIQGSVVVTVARQRGASDAVARYLYALDFARIKQFAAKYQNPSIAAL